jgi:hypothetical protein
VRRTIAAVAGVVLVAVCFGFAGRAVIRASASLATDIDTTIRTFKPADNGRGLNLVIVDGELSDFADGLRLMVAGVFLGGLPAALVGIALGWMYRDRARLAAAWSQLLLTAFVFQVSNVALLALILLALFAEAGNPFADRHTVLILAALVGNGIISAAAVRSWRALLAAVSADRVSIRLTDPSIPFTKPQK